MVHLSVEKHDFAILNFLGLKLVKRLSNLGVIHRQACMLLMVFFLLLKLFHEYVLLVKKKLLSRALDQLTVDFLGQSEDVVERAWRLDSFHLDLKPQDFLIKRRLRAKFFKVYPSENFDNNVRNKANVHLKQLFLLEDALVVDDRAAEQSLKHKILAFDSQVDFGNTMLNDVNRIDRVANLLKDFFWPLNCLHLVDHIVEISVCVLKVCKEGQLPQRHLDKSHVLVFVLEYTFLDALKNLGILVAHIVEVFLGHASNRRVLLRYDGGRGHAVVDEGDLTKELTLEKSECLATTLLLRAWLLAAGSHCSAPVLRSLLHVQVATTEVHGALAFGDDVEELAFLKLLNEHVIRTLQLNCNLRDNRIKEIRFDPTERSFRHRVILLILLGELHNG